MTAPVLADALGPKARRRVLVASLVAGAVILALIAVAVQRLEDNGQFEARKWEPFKLWSVWKFFLGGLANTVKVALVSMALAMGVGAVMALARLARNPVVRQLGGLYVEFFRGLPLYLLILFSFFGLPNLEIGWLGVDRGDIRFDVFWYLVIGLSVYNSAILAEVFRAGILSLERGQSEAAYAVGLGYWQTMGLVVIPQAVRRMIPAIVSQLVTLLKDTSLGFLIAYEELLRRAKINGEFFQNNLQSLTLAALLYIVVNSFLSFVATRLEARQRRRYGAGAISVTGIEDLAVVGATAEARLAATGDLGGDGAAGPT